SAIRSVVGACCPRTLRDRREYRFLFALTLRVCAEAAPRALVRCAGELLTFAFLCVPPCCALASALPPPNPSTAIISPNATGSALRHRNWLRSLIGSAARLLGIVRRHNARQEHRQHAIVVRPAQNFEHHILPGLQFRDRRAIVRQRSDGLAVDLRNYVAAREPLVVRKARRINGR